MTQSRGVGGGWQGVRGCVGQVAQRRTPFWGFYPFVLNKKAVHAACRVLPGVVVGLHLAWGNRLGRDRSVGQSRCLGMETIQVAIANAAYATALRELLARNAGWRILSVEAPDPRIEGVIVVDSQSLDGLPRAIENPQRVVLITPNEAAHLAKPGRRGSYPWFLRTTRLTPPFWRSWRLDCG